MPRARLQDSAEAPAPDTIRDSQREAFARLLGNAKSFAADVLQTMRNLLAPQERIVLWEYLREPVIKQTALRLGRREQTIRNQLVSIRGKLQAKSLPELVAKVLIAHFVSECGDSTTEPEAAAPRRR
jgi:DNA-binding CsgD family transcriptional regulator